MTAETPTLGPEEIKHFEDLARQFASRSVQGIFGGEHSDGDLSQLPSLIDTALEIGIAASPDPEGPGSEYGIWGSGLADMGLGPSLILLSAVAETCGGIAMALHAQGVASNLLLSAGHRPEPMVTRAALCLQEGFTLFGLGTLLEPASDAPAAVTTTAAQTADGYTVAGEKSFVYSLPKPGLLVVLCRAGKEWACLAVPADAAGVEMTDVGRRTGLRAATLNHVRFNGVTVPASARVGEGDAGSVALRAITLNWAGMTAIATGIARGALAAARVYCAERYQGGTVIENHPAVKSLLSGAEALALSAGALVNDLSGIEPGSLSGLRRVAASRLAAMEHCCRATTDALQTLGGYGYMEDYGLEKRLRDVTVLKSAAGSPLYLRQLIADIEKRERV
jgi:alkylation response protein AidB-like acyl-CoA dehydrogenase